MCVPCGVFLIFYLHAVYILCEVGVCVLVFHWAVTTTIRLTQYLG